MRHGFIEAVRAITGGDFLKEAADMSAFTTMRVGGRADLLAAPETFEKAGALIKLCKDEGVRHLCIGNGSNLIISDGGFRGLIIKIGSNLGEITVSGNEIIAEAGAALAMVSAAARRAALSGAEFAAGIPGTLGGGVYMNAGAYGGEMAAIVKRADYLDDGGRLKSAAGDELMFSHRRSLFTDSGFIIARVVLQLSPGREAEIKEKMDYYNACRKASQPLDMPSAGSVFKRPAGFYAGRLIEDSGLKGRRIGGAAVSEKHAGFIINLGGATARDVYSLVRHIQSEVFEKFGVRLEPEIRFIGEM